MAGANAETRIDRRTRRARGEPIAIRIQWTAHLGGLQHDLREAGDRIGDELAVCVGRQQRQVEDVGIVELDAEHGQGLRLDIGPGGEPAVGAIEQPAGGDRLAGRVELVFPQEHLVRGMRGVGLVLVDEGCRLVGVLGAGGGGPRQHHEVGGAAFDVERIVRLQRNEDRFVAALVDEVEAVIEELAEEREPRVERRRETFVGRHVRNGQKRAERNGIAIEIQQGTIGFAYGAQPGLDEGTARPPGCCWSCRRPDC